MTPPSDIPSDGQPALSPARQRFLQRLAALAIKLAARDYFVRWAEDWTKARGHQSAARTQAFSTPLVAPPTFTIGNSGGSVGVPPAVRGILPHTLLRMPRQRHLLAHQVLTIPWATTFDWQGLADQAWALEPDHRTLGREAIPIRAVLPPPPDPSVPLPDTDAEIARITAVLRRSIRLAGLAYATEQTYVYWNRPTSPPP